MSVIVDFSIYPLASEGESLSPYVARAVNIIKASGLSYQLGPMGTAIEGDWEDIMNVVNACYKELSKDCDRVFVNLKADCRKGRKNGLSGKVRSVSDKLV